MRTSDFTSRPTAKVMNETLNKKFGEKLDIDNYSPAQLEKAASLIESRISVLKKGKFNETLESEEFHRLKLMQDIVRTAISERAVSKSQQQAAAIALHAPKSKLKGASKEMSKMKSSELKKFAKTKHKGLPKHVEEAKKVKEAPNEGNAFGKAVRDAKKDGIQKGEKVKVGGKTYPVKEAAKPDFLDLDKDGNKKEPMKKAAKDAKNKKLKESLDSSVEDWVNTTTANFKTPHFDDWMEVQDKVGRYLTKKGVKFNSVNDDAEPVIVFLNNGEPVAWYDIENAHGYYPGVKRPKNNYVKRESVMKESVMKSISRLLREGEESKAELIMAVKDMVDKFTGWSEDIAQMQANTAMEMADAIRDELGADQAEAFTASVQPALDAAFQSVKGAREALNGSVASLTGVAPTPMGAEPGMDMEPDMEPGMDVELDAEMPTDDAEMDMDVDTAAPVDRAKRESIEHRLRLTKLLVGR